jgi:hypothetical protein
MIGGSTLAMAGRIDRISYSVRDKLVQVTHTDGTIQHFDMDEFAEMGLGAEPLLLTEQVTSYPGMFDQSSLL